MNMAIIMAQQLCKLGEKCGECCPVYSWGKENEVNFWLALGAAALAGLVIGFVLAKICRRGKPCGCGRDRKRAPRYTRPVSDGSCVEIYVGNLSYDTTEDQLRKAFEKYGKVQMARIISNRFGKSKGFGFVEMPNRPEAEAAIAALNDFEMQDRKLRVNEARNDKPRE